jgi:hypothetical protein
MFPTPRTSSLERVDGAWNEATPIIVHSRITIKPKGDVRNRLMGPITMTMGDSQSKAMASKPLTYMEE